MAMQISSHSKKILVVDDEVQVCGIISSVLELEGFEVITAYSAQEALEKIQSEHPDLIICDRIMPDLRGEEMMERVRYMSAALASIPVIFVSALTTGRHVEETQYLNPAGYLPKPTDFNVLLEKVADILIPPENVPA